MDHIVMPHKFEMRTDLCHTSAKVAHGVILHVIGRKVIETQKGVAIVYRCRQIRNGELLRDTIEVDESELKEISDAAQ